MFGKKNNDAQLIQEKFTSLIDENCLIEGNIIGKDSVRIDGKLKGNITIKGGLVLGEKGMIKGDANADVMVIYGEITGDINASTLELKKTARIIGNITTTQIKIEPGATYNGTINMSGQQQNEKQGKSKSKTQHQPEMEVMEFS